MSNSIINNIKTSVKWLILKEGNKISISKASTWLAGACGTIIGFQNILVSYHIPMTHHALLIFKAAGIVSAVIALIRTRHSQISI